MNIRSKVRFLALQTSLASQWLESMESTALASWMYENVSALKHVVVLEMVKEFKD